MKRIVLSVLAAAALLTFQAAVSSFQANAQTGISFADPEVGRCALNAADRNGDGILTKVEADSLTVLNLTPYRVHIFEVKTYQDLAQFPNLKQVWLGESELKSIDLSANTKLEFICIQSESVKTVTIAVGCNPKFVFPNRSGEVTIRRVVNPNNPDSIWYY